MELLIVTGMSGAGKSTVLKFLEDIGYYCIDNMPPALIPKFAEIIFRSNSGEGGSGDINKVALGVDIRGGRLFDEFLPLLKENLLPPHTIVFLDAPDQILVKRYKETRRKHPMSENDRIIEAIGRERERLADIKDMADHIIETGYFLVRELKERINTLFLENEGFHSLSVTMLSFGFKYGIPHDADLLFDVRFLPNPFYDPVMKTMTGHDADVVKFALENDVGSEFLDKLQGLLDFLLPHYIQEGKNQLIIGIGCTGGKHRSVAVANHISGHLGERGYFVNIKHRDIAL